MTGKDDADDKTRVEGKARQDFDQLQTLLPQEMRIVEDQDRLQTIRTAVLFEALLDCADQSRKVADDPRTDGVGDLPTKIPPREVAELEIARPVAGLGQPILEAAQDGRLTGAGGRQQYGRHPPLDRVLKEVRLSRKKVEIQTLFDGNLASKWRR